MSNLPYKFELAGYCEGCPYFYEDRDSFEVSTLEDTEQKVIHVIRCNNRDACARAIRVANATKLE